MIVTVSEDATMNHQVTIIACQLTALLFSICGLGLEYTAIELRFEGALFYFVFGVSICIAASIIFTGDHIGRRNLLAAHHIALIIVMIIYTIALQTIGQNSSMRNIEHKGSNLETEISELEVERKGLEKKIDIWIDYEQPSKAKESSARVKEINGELSALRSQSTVNFSDSLTSPAAIIGMPVDALTYIINLVLALIISIAPFFLMMIAAYRAKLLGNAQTDTKGPTKGASEKNTASVQPSAAKAQTAPKKSNGRRKKPTEAESKAKIDSFKSSESGRKWVAQKGKIKMNKIRQICGVGDKKVKEYGLEDYANKSSSVIQGIFGVKS